MRLGSSLRRSRGKKTSKRSTKKRGGSRRRRSSSSASAGATLRTIGIALVIGLVGGSSGYLFATQLLYPAPAPPSDLRAVPDLRGLSLAEAREALAAAGLESGDPLELNHPETDSGAVLGQSPLAGQLAIPGAVVELTVSLGPELRTVPEVTRLRGDRAVALLEAAGFEVEVDSLDSPDPRGRILAVEPAAGTELELPGAVSLTVSVGPATVRIPSLLGMEESAARDTLVALGLEVSDVEEVFRFGRDQGRVVEQEPAEGVEVDRGAAVKLVVGRRGGTPQDR